MLYEHHGSTTHRENQGPTAKGGPLSVNEEQHPEWIGEGLPLGNSHSNQVHYNEGLEKLE